MRRILSYVIAWHPQKNQARVLLKVEGLEEQVKVPVESAHEVAALAAILRHPSACVSEDGWIGTGWEDPGS